ncbi:MAG: hypothetical protein V3S24_20285, partial [Candidatus Tectomicrobia bacterium]
LDPALVRVNRGGVVEPTLISITKQPQITPYNGQMIPSSNMRTLEGLAKNSGSQFPTSNFLDC